MSLSESLFWFKEPGFVATLFFCFFSAYVVSAKTKPIVQIVICCYLSTYIITQWAKGDHFSMGLWWLYIGWAGFLCQKINGLKLFGNLLQSLRTRRSHTSQRDIPPQHSHDSATTEDTQRQQGYQQSQTEYTQREQARESWYQQRAEPEEEPTAESEPDSRTTSNNEPPPEPEPEPKQETPPKPPEPEPKKKRPWWEVLEVSQNADLGTIKKAHRTMVKRYHPDKVAHFGEEFRAKAEERVKEINAAYDEIEKGF